MCISNGRKSHMAYCSSRWFRFTYNLECIFKIISKENLRAELFKYLWEFIPSGNHRYRAHCKGQDDCPQKSFCDLAVKRTNPPIDMIVGLLYTFIINFFLSIRNAHASLFWCCPWIFSVENNWDQVKLQSGSTMPALEEHTAVIYQVGFMKLALFTSL